MGVPLALVTVAVKVTEAPYTDGFRDEETVVVVAGLFTDRLKEPLLVAWLASPP